MTATVLRSLLIAALITSAGVHLERWLAGYRYLRSTIGDTEYLIIGSLFLVNVAAGLAIAIGVGVWRHWLPLLAALGFGAGTLAAFFASGTVGLFGPPTPLQWQAPESTAAIAEALCIVCAALLLAMRHRR